MKSKFFLLLAFSLQISFLTPAGLAAQDTSEDIVVVDDISYSEDEPIVEPEESFTIWDFITEHLAELILGLLALVELVVRWTPTEKDDSWFEWLRKIIDAIFPSALKNRAGPGSDPKA